MGVAQKTLTLTTRIVHNCDVALLQCFQGFPLYDRLLNILVGSTALTWCYFLVLLGSSMYFDVVLGTLR